MSTKYQNQFILFCTGILLVALGGIIIVFNETIFMPLFF